MLFVFQIAQATHNRAGEIIYEHVSGFTYKVTINTITKASSTAADRPWLKIRWGDEPSNILDTELDSLERSLEEILPGDAKKNQYIGYHTYAGAGIFTLIVEDPNRNFGVINIFNSVNQVFTLQTVLVISPQTGHNNSVQLLKPPIEQACIFQPWIHNPVAFDPDGDSLVYSLVPCLGENALTLTGWAPPEVSTSDPTDLFTIDSQTGDVQWLVPPLAGEFNIAILIQEYRNGIFVGSVLRDMQITVITCNNEPPVIFPLLDYCVEAGGIIQFQVQFSDPNGDNVDITAFGGPMSSVVHEAEFNPFTNQFTWQPECDEVRAAPYTVSFEALDDGYVNLADIESVNITVVAPKVENVQATAVGPIVNITWNASPCANSFSAYEASQVNYLVYRKQNGYPFVPDLCEVGMPGYTGFQLIGNSQGLNNTSFTDNAPGFGVPFCYRIVTVWPDGAQSYASEETCITIRKDVPVITNVSVINTDALLGADSISWSAPSEIDTTIYLPPYFYLLEHKLNDNWETVYTSADFNSLNFSDTTFVHSGINTSSILNEYRVKFFSQGQFVAQSSVASSPFCSAAPFDNEVSLDVSGIFPWLNYRFDIYRKAPGELSYTFLTSSANSNYIDTGLVNNQNYCYLIQTLGTYDTPSIEDSLWNWSQEICATPYDATPPCAPTLQAASDCENLTLELNWNFLDGTCANDVTAYIVYYSETESSSFTPLDTLYSNNGMLYNFTHPQQLSSIAGCFAVTALDSLNLWPDGLLHQNESVLSNIICVDNCPTYELPNIITPNSDEFNDIFEPFPYRSVASVSLRIFNRYGTQVFHTENPDILWNGEDENTGLLCTDGVYYYTIMINTIRKSGIVSLNKEGYIQMLNATQATDTE
ncbi:MAG: gliding motility-associated C-terminal domain-containing protein [Bacteroidota bacterium]